MAGELAPEAGVAVLFVDGWFAAGPEVELSLEVRHSATKHQTRQASFAGCPMATPPVRVVTGLHLKPGCFAISAEAELESHPKVSRRVSSAQSD